MQQFAGRKEFETTVPVSPLTLRALVLFLRDKEVRARPELFMEAGDLRPGVLCLVNEADMELLDEGMDSAVAAGGCRSSRHPWPP